MSVLKIKDKDGNWVGVHTVKGDKGDSEYELAVKNGYTGTEEEWLSRNETEIAGLKQKFENLENTMADYKTLLTQIRDVLANGNIDEAVNLLDTFLSGER